MYAFTYHRPGTVRQAANMLAKNEDAKLLAGGQTLLPTMKLRLAGPPQILDMWAIEGLSGIEESGRSITIGAMTKHFEVNDSPVVQKAIPVLAHMAGLSAIRRCVTWARSAARSPTTTRTPIIRRHVSRSAPPSSPTNAASRPTIT